MKATIRDPELLSSIGTADLNAYLAIHGWAEQRRSGRYATVWVRRGSRGRAAVLVPTTGDVDDYADRVADLLAALEDEEERSQIAIVHDLQAIFADVLRVPATDAGSSGSISIERGTTLVERAKEMVLAAARAAVEPKALYGPKRPAKVRDYLDSVRLGQTERGSYVLTVHSPVPKVPQFSFEAMSVELTEVNDPFSRQATRTLARALASMTAAAELAVHRDDISVFEEAVREGVSANLCSAVVGLAEATAAEHVTVHFSWSPTRPVADDIPVRVDIPRRVVGVIAAAETHFRERSPREGFEIEGLVVGLERPENAQIGRVKVHTQVDGAYRMVLLELADADYRTASSAHADREPIRCVGELVKEGKSYQLRVPHGFERVCG